jgi:hypothetical protein
VDGLQIAMKSKPTMAELLRVLGCSCIDTVNLGQDELGAEQVMVVDDTGMIDGKPINPVATVLYQASLVRRRAMVPPGEKPAIHGDVALVNDEDFD